MAFLLRLLILLMVIYFVFRFIKKLTAPGTHPSGPTKSRKSPYTILGVDPNSSQAEIQRAYKEQLAKYHPDKVDHLGIDLQAVAIEKTQEIIEAYNQLRL